MIVVILVVGGLGYVGLNAAQPGVVTKSSCEPATSAQCSQGSAAHDISLQVPFRSVQQGNPVPFAATLPGGETASSYNFTFGDGTNSGTVSTSSVTHSYANPGTYIASVTALVKGAVHDNYFGLVIITVSAAFTSAQSSNVPGVAGAITANSSGASNPTAILAPGGTVSFSGSYTGAPTNPAFSLAPPTVKGPSTPTSASNTSSSAAASFSFPNPGTFTVTFVGLATSASANAYQNYTWTVFVAPTGLHAGAANAQVTTSPHKGTLSVYELAPGGSNSEDPAIDYETLGYEPILNVYQTLVAYNGTRTGPSPTDYVPVIATCVPGSTTGANNCQSLYGSSLSDGTNYTFVISPNAKFYDPNTGNSWGVYPTDVLFSIARTMAFADLPCAGCNNGWILTQSLLPNGNASWDGGIHAPYNNTPQGVFQNMIVNGTSCPAAALTNAHGCITFQAVGGGLSWPYFLELIADPLGASIVPCGWFSAAPQSAGIPDWTYGNVNGNGDHPCGMPGSTGYGVAPSAMSPKAWDTWQLSGNSAPYWGNVQWAMAGSGPYYMADLRPGVSYFLRTNPAYTPNPLCTWTGCWPAVGTYAGNVSVTWETNQVPGEQAYAAGTADFATIPSTDVSFLLQLVAQGKLSATSFPSISIFFFPFDMNTSLSGAAQYTSNPITIPADFFSHVGVRETFARSYPYNTIQQNINTKGGIQYFFNYGGAIPQFMANYYPTNVSWPSGDPVDNPSLVGSAAWWWQQTTTQGTPYYSKEISTMCTRANPCQLPLFGQTGAPDLDQRIALWISQIETITNGAVKPTAIDINFVDEVILSTSSAPGTNPLPVFNLGWAPDYPDPTDYVTPMYQADATYTRSDAVVEQLSLPQFSNTTVCGSSTTNYTYWSNVAQTTGGIPEACQGIAYKSMLYAMGVAAVAPVGPGRVLLYNEIEQIANGLALYVYWGQQNLVFSGASWINLNSINQNVCIGGGGDQTWYTIQGNGVV